MMHLRTSEMERLKVLHSGCVYIYYIPTEYDTIFYYSSIHLTCVSHHTHVWVMRYQTNKATRATPATPG